MKIDIRFNDVSQLDDLEDKLGDEPGDDLEGELAILDSDLEYILSVRERITSSVSAHRKEVFRREFMNDSESQIIECEDDDSSETRRPVGYSRSETSRSAKKNKSRRQEMRRTGMGLKDPESQISIPYIISNPGINMDFDEDLSEVDDDMPSANDLGLDILCDDRTDPAFVEAYLQNPRVHEKKSDEKVVRHRNGRVAETPVHLRMGEYVTESHARMVKKIAQSRAVLTSFINGTNWDVNRRLKELRGKLGNPYFAEQKGTIELEIAKLENVRRIAYNAMKRTKSRVIKMKREQKLGVGKKNTRRYQIRQRESKFFRQAATNLTN